MKKNLLTLAMSLALMGAAAHAQTTHMQVTVPFGFVAGNTQLPAGEYEVKALGPWGGQTLSIHNINTKAESVVVSHACRSQKAATDSKLVFRRYGREYFLAEVWNRNGFAGSEIQTNSRQTELARNQSKDEVVLVASRK